MNSLHRQHLTSPAATSGAHCLRKSLWVVSYPLAHVLPLLIGYPWLLLCPVWVCGGWRESDARVAGRAALSPGRDGTPSEGHGPIMARWRGRAYLRPRSFSTPHTVNQGPRTNEQEYAAERVT
jgi:hypothetical protein